MRIGVTLAALALVAPAATGPALGDGGADDGTPRGTVAFFVGDSCPPGWTAAADARGRVLVGVGVGEEVGVAVGTPLGDQEDRPHVHPWVATLALPAKNIAAANGGNGQGAAATSYALAGQTDPGPSGLPFAQLLACEKP
jgi:hypothetical protein